MRRVPVDTSHLTALALKVGPKVVRGTGEQLRDPETGAPRWVVETYLADASGEGTLIRVTVPSAHAPEVMAGTPVHLAGLRVQHWETNGRSGLAWSADSVAPATRVGRDAA